MHYIRFLKAPRISPNHQNALSAKITITTDLGESFLPIDVALVVELEDSAGKAISKSKTDVLWTGSHGMRALEIRLPFSSRSGNVRMLLRPKEERYVVERFEKLLEYGGNEDGEDSWGENGGIVTLRSMHVDLSGKKSIEAGLAERVFVSGRGSTAKKLRIWEETGESIARHIWDAGLILSSYLTTICQKQKPNPTTHLPQLPKIEELLSKQNLKIIELGAGCGIVSLSLFQAHPSISHILLSDLAEASPLLTQNLTLLPPSPKISHQTFDWSHPLPDSISSTKFDLILVADCTYNPDVVPDLVATLGRIAEKDSALVCLAMKVRHESEMVFFELMGRRGFEVWEKGGIALPVIGGDGEEIEIFCFGMKES